MALLKDLILEAKKLEKKASDIQLSTSEGSPVDTNWLQAGISEFADEYHLWYAECLAALPNDLKDPFRSAYEGNSGQVCIKRFIESPLERVEIPIGNGWRGVRKIHIRWKYPYDSNFRKPLLTQKQILIEANVRPQEVQTFHDAIATVERLARNFHSVVHQLGLRYDSRPGFTITDEYDVQDLFHVMLIAFFEDIRPEEGTPSHAGKNSRIDFLLKAEQIVIEIKKTRKGLTAKKVGEELTIDKEYYRPHPNCKAFIAFVYDPERYIDNPRGLEKDLSRPTDDMLVKIIINQG